MSEKDFPEAITGTYLTPEQRFDWLRLIRCENIGPRTFRQLLNRFGGAGAALKALPEIIAKGGMARQVKLASVDSVARELEMAERAGVRFIALGEPDYPPLLRLIDAPPPLIALRGDARVLQRPMVAIVGSRNASAAGLVFAERMAQSLAGHDYVIVSGLARGIDYAAHMASLATGTVAVLAGGHNKPYPSEHVPLLGKIAEIGAAISEMPLDWEPRGRDFPRRNRLVAGLAYGTVVVEAARKSGSLVTARFAREQGREVFAVPGSPLDPRTEGTNDLLRQGATLCTKPEDVLEALAPMLATQGRFLPRDDLFRENADLAGREEPLWGEVDLFGELFASAEPLAPLVSTQFEVDEPKADYQAQDRNARDLGYLPDENQVAFHGSLPQQPARAVVKSDVAREKIVALRGPSPIGVDELARMAQIPVNAVQGVLLDLELEGKLDRHGGNLVSMLVGV